MLRVITGFGLLLVTGTGPGLRSVETEFKLTKVQQAKINLGAIQIIRDTLGGGGGGKNATPPFFVVISREKGNKKSRTSQRFPVGTRPVRGRASVCHSAVFAN